MALLKGWVAAITLRSGFWIWVDFLGKTLFASHIHSAVKRRVFGPWWRPAPHFTRTRRDKPILTRIWVVRISTRLQLANAKNSLNTEANKNTECPLRIKKRQQNNTRKLHWESHSKAQVGISAIVLSQMFANTPNWKFQNVAHLYIDIARSTFALAYVSHEIRSYLVQ